MIKPKRKPLLKRIAAKTKKAAIAVYNFAKEVVQATVHSFVDFCKGCVRHAESTSILVLASLGLNALLGEIPFYFAVPFFIEGAYVIPIASVCIILLLLRSAEWRANRRVRKAERKAQARTQARMAAEMVFA